MSTLTPAVTPEDTPAPPTKANRSSTLANAKSLLSSRVATVIAIVIAVLWTIPTAGLLITSFRKPLDINRSGWWTVLSNPDLTLDNYRTALGSGTSSLADEFVNSIVITIPAVLLPILLATLAAYAFAWMDFKGRNLLFVAVFTMQIVPIQVTMIPLLSMYVNTLHLNGTFWSVWISHTIFALPLAVFLMHNFIKEIPGELVEAARVDGAGHVRIFFRVMLPLLTPALAAFGIFQFLWVWNDLLVSLVFLGGSPEFRPITVAISELAGTRGSAWFLLSAGAFIAMVVPVIVFLSLQRYFVRGLLAGGLKG
jgi:alpha-glucoside transport system permease protein